MRVDYVNTRSTSQFNAVQYSSTTDYSLKNNHHVGVITGLLYWIALDCTGGVNKLVAQSNSNLSDNCHRQHDPVEPISPSLTKPKY